jgi:phage shock protein A
MIDFDDLVEELQQKRDQLRVQMNLASREMKDEWDELEEKLGELTAKAKQLAAEANLKETGEGVGKAVSQLGDEIKLGYERIWKALKDD